MKAFLFTGLLFGVPAGWAWHRMHRAWTDWRRVVASIALLRHLFWRESLLGALWAIAVVIVAAVLLHL